MLCDASVESESSMELAADFVERLRSVIGPGRQGLHEPAFEGNEKQYLEECIDSGFVSSVGEFVNRFEHELADFVGASFCVALANGTTALHLALAVGGIEPGDEVLVPALSFVATASAVVHAGAVPHFVDVDADSWGIDPLALRRHLEQIGEKRPEGLFHKETGRRIRGLVPMHTLGHPSHIDQLVDIANEFDLVLVEDAAESLGSYWGETHTGLFGSMGVFSFNGNKTMTTGGGGALVTNDAELAAKAKHLSTTARVPHLWEFDHDAVGFNFRMPNINAALGVAQLEQTPGFIAGHRELFDLYAEAFSSSAHGVLRKERKGTHSNYWLQAFELSADDASDRDDLLRACIADDIQVRPLWKPLNSFSPYLSFPSAPTPVTEDLYSRVVCLPSTPGIVKH